MKGTYNPAGQWYSASEEFNKTFQLPPTATLQQHSNFHQKIGEIEVEFNEQIELAYLSAFDVELEKDEGPNDQLEVA